MHPSLHPFLPPIARWFEDHLGLPTPPQQLGWPAIAARQSTLILAPTGSGKTLAAFLAAIDRLARDHLDNRHPAAPGVQILYLSPLKALANDIQKNLLLPLEGIAHAARTLHHDWPDLRVAVRTGDTPARERAAMLRHPPDLLITTPESLHLLLTSSARRTLRSVRYVIVDEVHALAGTKRGVFLSLLLERLEHERLQHDHLADPTPPAPSRRRKTTPAVSFPDQPPEPLIRIGLSATVRPAERIAAWLAGLDDANHPRPIQIIDTGQRKRLDLAVLCPWSESADPELVPEEKSNWPAIARLLLQLIRDHRSTLIFANSRRLVERLIAMLQEQANSEISNLKSSPSSSPVTPRPLNPVTPLIKPHHGSISKSVRLATEQALKAGELSAVVATASLELGIDIGALDLVCQVDSPGNVAAALQRVGRAGHLEKATAKGRMVPKSIIDLAQFAALVPLMLAGTVEETLPPKNCLDVLAQQIVAACAVRSWPRHDLYRLFRRSANFSDLPEESFDATVRMLTPISHVASSISHSSHARLAWDRVNDLLTALPSGAHVALTDGGVIPDTGQFPVYIADRPARLGELDEEFVYESKVGDRIVLGSQVWEIQTIDLDRVTVVPTVQNRSGRMPFWRGETASRSPLLAAALGRLLREIETRFSDQGADSAAASLADECRLDPAAADELVAFVHQQSHFGSALPTDQRIVIEHFPDRTGEPLTAILTPWGSRVHLALRLALEARLADRRIPAQIVHNDDGLLLRPAGDSADLGLPANPLELLPSDQLEALVIDQLEESALFGLRFRQNAARALLLPRANPKRRTPLWQQRLRAKNLLAVVKRQRNHPLVLETYRECLQDVLLVEQARDLLRGIETGAIEVAVRETHAPSPLVRGLWWNFENTFLYQWDNPLTTGAAGPSVDAHSLDAVLQRHAAGGDLSAPGEGETGSVGGMRGGWLPEDVATLQCRLTGADYPARTPDELAEKMAAAGPLDLGPPDDPRWAAWVTGDAPAMLTALQDANRLLRVEWPEAVTNPAPNRKLKIANRKSVWLTTESLALYLAALGRRPKLFRFQSVTASPNEKMENGKWKMENPNPGVPWVLRVPRVRIVCGPVRWQELPRTYRDIPPALLTCPLDQPAARRALLESHLHRTVLVTLQDLQSAFPFMAPEIPALLAQLSPILWKLDTGHWTLREHRDQLRDLALRRQRRAIGTTDLPALQHHLLIWHRILPINNQKSKIENPSDALASALDQLSPLPFPLSAWEYDLLPLRVPDFAPHLLEHLIAQGHWVPVGADADALAFIPRHLLAHRPPPPAAPAESPPLSPLAARIRAYLTQRGASYLFDLEVDLGESPPTLLAALRELFAAGLVSNDRLEPLRALADASIGCHGSASFRGPVPSGGDAGCHGDASLCVSMPDPQGLRSRDSSPSPPAPSRDIPSRPPPRPIRSARLGPRAPAHQSLTGRWFLLPDRLTEGGRGEGDPLALAEAAAERTERFLRRHGFACRELCVPAIDGPWRDHYAVLTRLEWAGAVRRGIFVADLPSTQFALPTVHLSNPSPPTPDPSRPSGPWPLTPNPSVIWLSLLDPANLYAHLDQPFTAPPNPAAPSVPSQPLRIPRTPGSFLALVRGRPVLAATAWAQTLWPLTADESLLHLALAAVPALLARLPRPDKRALQIRHWAQSEIIGSPAEAPLRQAGFEREPQALVLHRQYP